MKDAKCRATYAHKITKCNGRTDRQTQNHISAGTRIPKYVVIGVDVTSEDNGGNVTAISQQDSHVILTVEDHLERLSCKEKKILLHPFTESNQGFTITALVSPLKIVYVKFL